LSGSSVSPLAQRATVRALGLQAAFFAVYLASKALFFWGLVRLVRLLVPDAAVAVLSLLGLAILPFFAGQRSPYWRPHLRPRQRPYRDHPSPCRSPGHYVPVARAGWSMAPMPAPSARQPTS